MNTAVTIFLIVLGAIPGIIILACILAAFAALYERIFYPHGHDVSPKQFRRELELILDKSCPRALDDFISCGRFKNPRFEAIRVRIAQMDVEFPPESQGEYFNSKGIEVIRGYIKELEHETAA